MSKRHTITINRDVYQRLKRTGFFNETYSQLISRLVDIAEKNRLSSKFKEDDER
jgi:predicted CopG family antitoxin